MAFDSFHITSSVGSATPLEVYPTWSFAEDIVINRNTVRTLGGQQHTYQLTGDYFRYSLPFTFVDSHQKGEFDTWWRDQRELVFTIAISSNPESLVVKVANTTQPLGIRSTMQYDRFSGTLFLNSVRSTTTALKNTSPFVLDDPTNGLLDQNYNFLDDEKPRPSTSGKFKGGPFLLDDGTWGLLDKTYNILI